MAGPAKILDTNEAGATLKSRSETFKVARNCLRRKVGERGADDEELDPLHARVGAAGSAPLERHAQRDLGDVMGVDEGKGSWTSSSDAPRSEDGYRRAAIPAPSPPALSVHLPS